MIRVSAIVPEAIDGYRRSGIKLTVPFQNYTPSPSNHIRPSSQGLCPLKAAYDKHRIPEDYPIDNSWLMNHGSYVEPMIQEPLMYHAMTNAGITYLPQKDFSGEIGGIPVSGRADGVLGLYNALRDEVDECLVEIKDTEGQRKRSLPDPKLRYVWQMLCGMLILGISQGALILCSKWGYRVFDLLQRGDGYVLYEGDEVYTVPYGDNWNTPERLGKAGLETELLRYQEYNSAVGKLPKSGPVLDIMKPPIEDPLNNSAGWECMSTIQKPTKTKIGLVAPNCPYCLRCHGLENKLYETKLVDKRTEILT